MTTRIAMRIAAILTMIISSAAAAQSADSLRGGWISDEGGSRRVAILVIREHQVTGIWCKDDCADPANLAFIDDGTLVNGALSFSLYHDNGNGEVSISHLHGELSQDRLIMSFQSAPMAGTTINFIRSPADTRAAAPSGGFGGPATPYVPPAHPEILDRDKVVGLWIAGTGPGKQYFIFKKHKDGLRGVACGPCLDASGMAPLENISINGTNLHFDIVHENSGPGILEYGPHANISDATISKNELHFATRPSFADENYALIHMTLLGPVKYNP